MRLKGITIAITFAAFFLYAGLIIALLYFYSGTRFREVLFSERILYSIKLSLATATISMLLAMFLALPAAYALSRYNFMGKQFIDTVFELPMIVSPAALGAMLLIFFNNPLGQWIQNNIQQFVFTVYGIILAQFVTVLGVAVRLVKASLDEIPTRYETVARTLGASSFTAFRTITLPLCKRGILAAAILTWAKAVGEFGASITLAGTMAMETETLPIAIYMRLATADIEGTVVSILILLMIGLGILFAVRLILLKVKHA